MQFNILFFIFQNLSPKSEKSPVSWPFFEIFQNFENICSFSHKRVPKQMDFLGGPKKAYFLPTANTSRRYLRNNYIKSRLIQDPDFFALSEKIDIH